MGAPSTEPAPLPPPPRRVPGDVLIVEDNYIIALDLEAMLRELGVETVRTASSVSQALDMIAAHAPQYALLDVNMGADKSFAIADRLRELGLPFTFSTGYGDSHAFPPQFAASPMLVKPYRPEQLRAVILGTDALPLD